MIGTITALKGGLAMIPFWIKLSTIAAAVSVVGSLVWAFDHRGNKIVQLKNDVAAAELKIEISNQNVLIRDKTIDELGKLIQGDKQELEQLCKMLKEIEDEDENDPNSDPIGGVLGGLQGPNTVAKTDRHAPAVPDS